MGTSSGLGSGPGLGRAGLGRPEIGRVGTGVPDTGVPGMSRRTLLAGLLLVPPALAGCSIGRPSAPSAPDPLIALADAARADVALATAAIAADPGLIERVQPLVDARTQHAAALDAEVARLAGNGVPPASAPRSAPASGAPGGRKPGLAQVREAVLASGKAATEAALGLPADRVGLVASVAACCTTYGGVLA